MDGFSLIWSSKNVVAQLVWINLPDWTSPILPFDNVDAETCSSNLSNFLCGHASFVTNLIQVGNNRSCQALAMLAYWCLVYIKMQGSKKDDQGWWEEKYGRAEESGKSRREQESVSINLWNHPAKQCHSNHRGLSFPSISWTGQSVGIDLCYLATHTITHMQTNTSAFLSIFSSSLACECSGFCLAINSAWYHVLWVLLMFC